VKDSTPSNFLQERQSRLKQEIQLAKANNQHLFVLHLQSLWVHRYGLESLELISSNPEHIYSNDSLIKDNLEDKKNLDMSHSLDESSDSSEEKLINFSSRNTSEVLNNSDNNYNEPSINSSNEEARLINQSEKNTEVDLSEKTISYPPPPRSLNSTRKWLSHSNNIDLKAS
tara:strand:+ start:130 stop:642 length:513 start_codon:yes stop_codon:yes gene_type:complete